MLEVNGVTIGYKIVNFILFSNPFIKNTVPLIIIVVIIIKSFVKEVQIYMSKRS